MQTKRKHIYIGTEGVCVCEGEGVGGSGLEANDGGLDGAVSSRSMHQAKLKWN